METHRRKADGRRVFTPQFKQDQVARVERKTGLPRGRTVTPPRDGPARSIPEPR